MLRNNRALRIINVYFSEILDKPPPLSLIYFILFFFLTGKIEVFQGSVWDIMRP